MTRRVLAFLLAMVMVLGMAPMQIFATETESVTEPVVTESVETTASAIPTEDIGTSGAPEESTTQPVEESSAPTEESSTPTEESSVPTEQTVEYTFQEDVPAAVSLDEEETEPETKAAESAQMTITVAVSGVLASANDGSVMVNKPVTVTDVNEDGKLSFEEALVAAHEAYCAQGKDGLVVEDGSYGSGFVKTLWGTATENNLFFVGNDPIAEGVSATTVAAGAKLFAAVLSDDAHWADYYTYFDKTQATVYTGEAVTLNLKGFLGMGNNPTPENLSGITLGTWENGSVVSLGKVTDESGNVTLSFDKPGTYYVTASGTVPGVTVTSYDPEHFGEAIQVDAPIIPPVCVVTVEEKPVPASLAALEFTANNKGQYALKLSPAFAPEISEYTLYVPDAIATFYAWATLGEGVEGDITACYTATNNTEKTVKIPSAHTSGTSLAQLIPNNSLTGSTFTVNIGEESVYTITVARVPSLKSLTLKLADETAVSLDNKYHSCTTEYSAFIPVDTKVVVTTGAKVTGATLTINGGTDTTLTPSWDNHAWDIVIKVSAEGVSDGIYTVHLYETPKSISVNTPPVKTSYNTGDLFDVTGMTLLATYADGSTTVLDKDAFTYAPTGALSGSVTAITASYSNLTVEQPIKVAHPFTGSGTEEAPYLLNNAEDLVALSQLVQNGVSFAGMYFKITDDVVLPAASGENPWVPLGVDKNTPFSGYIDGDNHLLTVPKGGLPLIGRPVAAKLSNLNVFGEQIDSCGVVHSYVIGATIDIDNVTLKTGTKTLKSGFIGGYASSNDKVNITNCTVESGVVIGYDQSQSNIGSFGGEFNGTISNCVSNATVYGVNFVGGIVGDKGQSMSTFVVDSCTFGGNVVATGNYVGGICGHGYGGTNYGIASAPNTAMVTITNCECTGSVKGADYVGGILGGETGLAQCWVNGAGSIVNNNCTATIAASGTYVGGVIGYMRSLNRYTTISGNTYRYGDKGIGGVQYVDTNCETHETESGAVYFSTETDTSGCPSVQYCGWKKQHNRTDDPLGADADSLCMKLTKTPTLEVMVNSSSYATYGTPQKAVLGDGNIFRIANRTAKASYLWYALEDGATLKYTLIQGSTSSSPSSYQNKRTSNNVYDGTTYTHYISTTYTLPMVARMEVTGADGGQATYYVLMDKGEVGSYAIGGTLTSDSELFSAETGISFTEAGETVTLTPKTETIGTGDEKNAAWKYTTSDNHVAVVDNNGVVTCVGGGTATITAKCDQITLTCQVGSKSPDHTTHTYGENNKCTLCGDRKPNDITAKFTLLDRAGKYMTAKDVQTELYKTSLTVSDLDCDGTITYVDLFTAAHTAFCAAGTDGFVTNPTEYGLFITKFWGEETSDVGYYCNNKVVYNMTDRITGTPNLVAFFYQDTVTYYDLYTWFDKDSSKTVTGYEKVFTVNGADGNAPKGATVTVLDETGSPVEALATTVDEAGKFTITFAETGTYEVWVTGTADYTTSWGEEATGAPVLPCFQTVEVFESKSAVLYMTIVDGNGNFVKTTDGEEVCRYAFKVVDTPENPDGIITIYEALEQIHAQKCPAGADGFSGGSFITMLWGEENYGWLGYYLNDVYMNGNGQPKVGTNGRRFVDRLLSTEIADGQDYYTIYSYQTYSDSYTYFPNVEQEAFVGYPKTFTAYGYSTYGSAAAPAGATITVTDSEGKALDDLATITDENGKFTITFPEAGSYTVTLSNGERQAFVPSRCFVTVTEAQADSIISLNGDGQILLPGQTLKLQPKNAAGKVVTTAQWTLEADGENYVTFSAKNGVATVKALEVSETHTVTLKVTAPGGGDQSVTLTIQPKAQTIDLTSSSKSVAGQTITVDIGAKSYSAPTLFAKVLPTDAEQSVTWKSSNTKVATVDNGKVTLTGTLGTAKITATTTDGTKLSASTTITVVKLAQSISLTGASSIRGGLSTTYTAHDDGVAIKASDILWSLSDTTYASVNASGKLTVKAVPETVELTLTATIKGSERSDTKTIKLYPAATYVDILMGEDAITGVTVTANVNVSDEGIITIPLSAKVYPEGASQGITWKSSNTKVATVDKTGMVTYAGKPGTVTITATAADGTGKKATMKITFASLATKVEIEEHAETLLSGEKLTLKAFTDLAKVGVKWMLADPADKAYVTLSTNGTVKAKTVYEDHEVTFCAVSKDGGAVAETTLTIQPKDEKLLVLKHGTENVTKTTQTVSRFDFNYKLTAATVAGETQYVSWKTSNKKVVTLSDAEGTEVTLTPLKTGTATITATASDGSKTTVTIKITSLVTRLTIEGSDTVASGKSITLKAAAMPTNASSKAVTWTLKDAGWAYATISSSGKLTAAKNLMTAKTVTVVATAKDGSGVVAEKEITIQPVATSIQVQQKAQTVDMQKTATLQLSAKVYPASANQGIQWTSSSTKIATVDAAGLVTFHKGGTVTITAATTDGSNKKSTVKLTVVKAVKSLSLDNNFLASGKSLNLAKLVEVGPADASNKKVTWSMSGDTAYATLSANGVLKAKTVTKMKTVSVTATAADGYKASVTATINIYPATTKVLIQVDGETATGTVMLPEGESLQLSAISLPLDAYQDWTWTSSKDAFAEVDETGCVTGLQAGKTVTITANANDGTGKKATLRIQITKD